MSKHNWTQSLFEPDGRINGRPTCIQHWKCRDCGETTALPLSMKPTDYDETRCRGGENVLRTSANDVRLLRGNNRLQGPDFSKSNRHEVRKLRSQSMSVEKD